MAFDSGPRPRPRPVCETCKGEGRLALYGFGCGGAVRVQGSTLCWRCWGSGYRPGDE